MWKWNFKDSHEKQNTKAIENIELFSVKFLF